MRRLFILLIIFSLILIACSSPTTTEEAPTSLGNDALQEVASQLQAPWSINKIGDKFLISERAGSIAVIQNGQLERQNVTFEKPLSSAAEAGLLGFVLSPTFEQSNEAFAYYTYEENNAIQNRVVILQQVENNWIETKTLIDGIPGGTYHHGGRLKIGPDNKLYITTGDASTPEIAQDLDSLGGKILRMSLDGSIPEDNPFMDSYIYSLGHRNPQGLAWSKEGQLYSTEHGPSANDEINEIYAGINYGWPYIVGTEEEKMLVSPLFTSGNDATWAPSGVAYANNNLYVAALRGQALLQVNLQAQTITRFVENVGRIRDVFIEGEHIYFITNNTDGRGYPSKNDDRLLQLMLPSMN